MMIVECFLSSVTTVFWLHSSLQEAQEENDPTVSSLR
jgi:hypothetical protein